MDREEVGIEGVCRLPNPRIALDNLQFPQHVRSHEEGARRAADGEQRMLGPYRLQGDRCFHTGSFAPSPGDELQPTVRRPGSVDPGMLVYVLAHQGVNVSELDHALNEQSGLEGVSGVSADMREVLAAADQGNARARLARDMFVHRVVVTVGGRRR